MIGFCARFFKRNVGKNKDSESTSTSGNQMVTSDYHYHHLQQPVHQNHGLPNSIHSPGMLPTPDNYLIMPSNASVPTAGQAESRPLSGYSSKNGCDVPKLGVEL
ncbi:hypothetical protein Salat_2944300 [Sesamum alatum]|uniref:Uncharacterized protein n=1 Tax=Sesamum alatum TaxID=300844 RepID=A0AAE2C8K2_9LAMI|nr:hypothetical protein Salat_2944300 [Sesamum alatum]